MLVVDRSVFTQLNADNTGIDFMELSANLIRSQRQHAVSLSTPSILDSDTTSKGISPTSLGVSPPAYEDIFGSKLFDLPPSYSEVSLMLRNFNTHMNSECIEMCNINETSNVSGDIQVNNTEKYDEEQNCDSVYVDMENEDNGTSSTVQHQNNCETEDEEIVTVCESCL